MTAEESTKRAGGINIQTAVTDEGEYKGRRVFIDLPPVDEQPWAAEVMARLMGALGTTLPAYTNPVPELNRLATNGHSRFQADVYIREFTRNDGSDGKQNKVNFKSFRPAA